MSNPVTGLASYSPATGARGLVALCNGSLSLYTGSSIAQYTGATISDSAPALMVQANGILYGTDTINAPFSFDGTTLQPAGVRDSASTDLTGVKDLLWFKNRMFWAVNDFVHFSDVGNPTSISLPALRLRQGGGDTVVRLMPHRDSGLLAFKSNGAGEGSIHLIDCSEADPENWSITPLFEGLSIVSPRSIVRVGNNGSGQTGQDIFFCTREGLRSFNFTSLDRAVNPTLPFTSNIQAQFEGIRFSQINAAHAVAFNDEVLWAVPVGSNTPDRVYAYNLVVPKDSPQQGWTTIDTIEATCFAVTKLTHDSRPALYYGTNAGLVRRAFLVNDASQYVEISKRITYSSANQSNDAVDKLPWKFILNTQLSDANTTISASLLFEDDEERQIGSQIQSSVGLRFANNGSTLVGPEGESVRFDTVQFPGTRLVSDFNDLHWDVFGKYMRRFKDVRVKLTSIGQPKILGWALRSTIEPYRYLDLDKTHSSPPAAGPIAETITSGALTAD